MNKLLAAVPHLKDWQKSHLGHTASRCLEAARWGLGQVGLHLPPAMPAPNNTAIANFEELVKDPAKYGWKQVHSPLGQYGVVLVYFKGCGWVGTGANRRQAGHISLFDDRTLIGNNNYPWSEYWAQRLVGAFVPVE